jgi:signal transduction histidine kinase/CheY-like chemotaxis protein
MKLRTSHLLLSLATAAPLLLFAVAAALFTFEQENDNIVNAALARNRATLAAVDSELQAAISGLRVLSTAASLQRRDWREFHREAAVVLAAQPSWQNVVLQKPDGEMVVDARAPWDSELQKGPRPGEALARAVATGLPAIGNLTFATDFDKTPGIAVRLPIVEGGQATHVLTAVIGPAAFERILVEQQLPAGWASGIVGTDSRLIARVPRLQAGMLASPAYRENTAAAREGWYRGRTLEGADTFTAFSRSSLTGWTIGYAIPSGLILGGALRSATFMAIGLALSALFVLGLSYWLHLRFARPMSQLAGAAKHVGSGAPLPDMDSSIDEVHALADALREADAALRRRTDELTLANENKAKFLALLSHELRNPLAPLSNGLALLSMDPDPSRRAGLQAMMQRQVQQLTRLIDDLLDVSRIDRGLIELRREPVRVADFVRAAVETCRPGVDARQHQLVLDEGPPDLYVDGDRVRLAQIVANLVTNAARYTPEHGRIAVSVEQAGDAARIAVEDNGSGFAPGDAERIFDLFVRLDASRATAGGLGIGLTLVRSLAELHGGRVSAHSEGVGKGARFTIELPLHAAPGEGPGSPEAVPRSGRHRRVLVADDNRDAVDTMAQILRAEGFEVYEAHDGQQALDLALRHEPHVAFIDLDMPKLPGLEVARRLRAGGGRMTLVALTGLGQPADLAASEAAGFDCHLTKPSAVGDMLRLAAGDLPADA